MGSMLLGDLGFSPLESVSVADPGAGVKGLENSVQEPERRNGKSPLPRLGAPRQGLRVGRWIRFSR